MRLTVPKGTNATDALGDIIEFLKQSAGDYPVLSTDMNLYFSLKNEIGHPYPKRYARGL